MIRLVVAPLAAGELTVRGDEHHYLTRVRRAKVGDAVELVDGAGRRARAVIENIGAEATVLRAEAAEAIASSPPRVRVLVPAIKGDRMDACIEKLVEVGADDVVVWPAARAVVRLDGERRVARLAHYQAIAQAASRQSGRATIPAVAFADSLAAALAALPPGGARVVLDPRAERAAFPAAADLTLVSGPEGGFAPDELDALAGFTAIGLGPRVLRAETAPVVAVALVRAQTAS
ncbi:MAG TPA: RsmE family RNA methyltransferase [Kofleriaceae bacterium]|nr:RsmE family RNA methyltransferase [Kofleriaceae bacterium]